MEDQYEVDERYSVEECLGDMMRVMIRASPVCVVPNGASAK